MEQEYELELEPNEQLDELSRRSNKDGTVDVPIIDWEKKEGSEQVEVTFRRPDGTIESEWMEWPKHANDESFKFIRLIDETPYTVATADELRGDEKVWVPADPDGWAFHLPQKPSARERVSELVPDENLWEKFVAVSWVSTMVALAVVILVLGL